MLIDHLRLDDFRDVRINLSRHSAATCRPTGCTTTQLPHTAAGNMFKYTFRCSGYL